MDQRRERGSLLHEVTKLDHADDPHHSWLVDGLHRKE